MMRRSDLCYDPLITLKGNGEKKTEAAFEEIEQLLVEEFPTTAQLGAVQQQPTRFLLLCSKLPYGNFLSIFGFFQGYYNAMITLAFVI